jgi:S-disulfanyl-L-cysteine oxidoreductase SoxD
MKQAILAGGVAALGLSAALAIAPLLAQERAGLFPYRDPAVVAEGRAVYFDHCAACHGAELEGQPDWRKADTDGYLPAPPHDATGHTWHHPDTLLFEITKHGTEAVVGGGYRSNMAGFGDILSDAEIFAVLAYIKSTWPPRIIERHDRLNADAEVSGR